MGCMRRTCLLAAVLLVAACGSKLPHTLVDDYAKKGTRLIVVPAAIPGQKAVDAAGMKMLREKTVEELYYKGYPRFSPATVDERIAGVGGEVRDTEAYARSAGGALGVDGVLFLTVEECGTSYFLTYAKTVAAVRYTLRSARTGEVLWSVRVSKSKRLIHITRNWLRQDVIQIYEPLLSDVVTSALATLPDGPDS